ncbi:hypothetical protein B0T24DRAFT_646748 [Lasiosphaeria ovina]|uniref:DUF3669 domain-containing protein n=1 Tax=Lasiosphaeria ovina TaxID=92902 RepID=A0AAE0KN94_9PEZI|nr:hypothetical protein B0T24DRAFT_646748 [Lasiosphaeria ovina]
MGSHIEQITSTRHTSQLKRIGYSSCGTIWSDALKDADIDSQYSAIVLKRGDGLPDRSISNERRIHRQILSAVQIHGNNPSFFRVNIPSAIDHLPPQSDKWKTILPRLLIEFVACEVLVSKRILPMPRETRHVDSVVNDKRNEHCLVRPYLGHRRQGIEELGLPIDEYAIAMADTLAFLLWVVRIDANDVEFVLARPRTSAIATTESHSQNIIPASDPSIGTTELTTGILGSYTIWLLDFDCYKELDMNETGVKVAA